MNRNTSFPLRLPRSLRDELNKLAARDGISCNQFIAIAVAEKVAHLEEQLRLPPDMENNSKRLTSRGASKHRG
jgi:hypothetical protein